MTWEPLEGVSIHAPAATFEITGTAELDEVPASLAYDGAADEDAAVSSSPFYVPAEGQRVTAWQLEISPSVVPGFEPVGWGGPETRDATARLSVSSGAQRLPIEPHEDTQDPLGASCTAGLPCSHITPGRYVMVTSVAKEGPQELIVSTDGEDQVLDLQSGEVTSSASLLAEQRSDLELQTSTTWPREVYTILTEAEADEQGYRWTYSDVELTYAGSVNSVLLVPYDEHLGWAQEGRAWLSVQITDDPRRLQQGSELQYDRGRTFQLMVGDESLTPVGDEAMTDYLVFDVPSDFTAGEFRYRPTGSFVLDDSPLEFQAENSFTLEILFEGERR
ncbi:hypothetical protein BJF86_05415 [Serinicoccus sp. CNJ-927]|uniref:hypothetical protein n=1 Tax=Serinicoccus sp. CNJ-927 TaxID=1904970 RepID=UPI000967C0A6|nr:hypothetical protein [Serinicoccus sp. CNJ-927]OLT40238.1 hypothetical protein BJF86_05415 [Serinicoccus sp. CNJ-927]